MSISVQKVSAVIRKAGYVRSISGQGRVTSRWSEGYQIRKAYRATQIEVNYTFGSRASFLQNEDKLERKIEEIRQALAESGIATTTNPQKTIIFIDIDSSIDTPAAS